MGYPLTNTRKLPSDYWAAAVAVLVLTAIVVTGVVWPAWPAGVYLFVWPALLYGIGREQQAKYRPDRIRR